jgi:hypothetical protein
MRHVIINQIVIGAAKYGTHAPQPNKAQLAVATN